MCHVSPLSSSQNPISSFFFFPKYRSITQKRSEIMGSSQQSFLGSTTISITSLVRPTNKIGIRPRRRNQLSCRSSSRKKDTNPSSSSSREGENKLGKLAIITLAAGVLTLGSVNDIAMAAKGGGRVGGQAFRSSAPRASSPRINNSRTNIYINPRVAPPLIGGYGYGFPFYGGWGWSPFSFFAPGPSVAVGVGGGIDFFFLLFVLSTAVAVVRRFTAPRDDDEDDY